MTVFDLAIPDKGAERDVKARVHSTHLGDGYVIDVPDGLNPFDIKYPVSFSNRPRSVIKGVESFMIQQAGRKFTWTGPDGETGLWVCQSWKANYDFDNNCSLSATFEKRYA
jgi:phage-related protein